MTAPRKLYGVTVKPHLKTPPRKSIDAQPPGGRPDMLEAVRQAVAENRQAVERPPQR